MHILFDLLRYVVAPSPSPSPQGKKVTKAVGCAIMGILLLHIALIFFALCLYEYLLSVVPSMTTAALFSALLFLLMACLLFLVMYKLLERKQPTDGIACGVGNTVNAFINGFIHHP